MSFHIKITNPTRPDRFIAYHPTGAIMVVADPTKAKVWPTQDDAIPTFERCRRTCVAPNTLKVEDVESP